MNLYSEKITDLLFQQLTAIFCLPCGKYKVFDSHSKDLFGATHPFGTCTLKSCTYWNDDTVLSIIENGKKFHQKYYLGKHMHMSDLPNQLQVGSGQITIVFNASFEESLMCSNMYSDQENLKTLIAANKKLNTGFLLWISGYCIGYII